MTEAIGTIGENNGAALVRPKLSVGTGAGPPTNVHNAVAENHMGKMGLLVAIRDRRATPMPRAPFARQVAMPRCRH